MGADSFHILFKRTAKRWIFFKCLLLYLRQCLANVFRHFLALSLMVIVITFYDEEFIYALTCFKKLKWGNDLYQKMIFCTGNSSICSLG